MGFLKKLEDFLEERVEGWLDRYFQGPVKPQEVARKAVQIMLKNQKVSINKVYAPNRYEIALSPEDWPQFEPIQQAFAQEVADLLATKAKEKGLTILGSPRISFKVDPELDQGNVKICTSFLEPVEEETKIKKDPVSAELPEQKEESFEDTLTFSKEDLAWVSEEWVLKVIRGPDEGKIFRLGKGKYFIGRKPDNDFCLNDSNVSRVHAKIEFINGHYVISDLGSTNGTFLNKRRIKESPLASGDHILIGKTELIFEEG